MQNLHLPCFEGYVRLASTESKGPASGTLTVDAMHLLSHDLVKNAQRWSNEITALDHNAAENFCVYVVALSALMPKIEHGWAPEISADMEA